MELGQVNYDLPVNFRQDYQMRGRHHLRSHNGASLPAGFLFRVPPYRIPGTRTRETTSAKRLSRLS